MPIFGLGAILITSLFVSVAVNYVATTQAPFNELGPVFKLTGAQLRTRLGINDKQFYNARQVFGPKGAHSTAGQAYDKIANLVLILIFYFKTMLKDAYGKAMLWTISGALFPVVMFTTIEPLKRVPQSKLTALFGLTVSIMTMTLGQGICVGAAMPLLFVPYYIWQRVSEARNVPTGIQPLAAPPRPVLIFHGILDLILGPIATLSTIVPTTSKHWEFTNLLFQFFPFVYLPLLVVPFVFPYAKQAQHAQVAVTSSKKNGEGSKTQAPAAAIVQRTSDLTFFYNLVSFAALGYQAISAYHLVPLLPRLWRVLRASVCQLPLLLGKHASVLKASSAGGVSKLLANKVSSGGGFVKGASQFVASVHDAIKREKLMLADGGWLLTFDLLGLIWFSYAIVLIDYLVDEWIVQKGKDAALQAEGTVATTGKGKKVQHAAQRVQRLHKSEGFLFDVSVRGHT